AQQQPQFEVATVKLGPPVAPGTPLPVNLGSFINGTAMLTNKTLSECIQLAYGIVSDTQIAGAGLDEVQGRSFRHRGENRARCSQRRSIADDAEPPGRAIEADHTSRTEGDVILGAGRRKRWAEAGTGEHANPRGANTGAGPWAAFASVNAHVGTGNFA